MNLPMPIMLGTALISLFVALAIYQIAKKTVNNIKYSWTQFKIKRLINEVTYQLVNSKKHFTAVPIEVADGVLSPKTSDVVEKHKAWSHHGDSTSFILPTRKYDLPIAFCHYGKKFSIWEASGNYYFKNENGLHTILKGEADKSAKRLVQFCREFSLRCITHRTQQLKRNCRALEECCS